MLDQQAIAKAQEELSKTFNELLHSLSKIDDPALYHEIFFNLHKYSQAEDNFRGELIK